MNKINHVEAQRIMNVMEQAMEKLQNLSLITRELLTASSSDDLLELADNDIREVIRSHKALEDSYNDIITSKKPVDKVRVCSVGLRWWISNLSPLCMLYNYSYYNSCYLLPY